MPIPNPFSPKKAQTTVFEEVIKLFWAGIVILVIFVVAIALMNLIISPADSGSKASYTRVIDSVAALYDERTEESYCVLQGFYLEPNWALVGFNADGVLSANNDELKCERGNDCTLEWCGWFGIGSRITKPDNCGTVPCICLCEGVNDCEKNNAICTPISYELYESGLDRFYFVKSPKEAYSFEYISPSGKPRGGLFDFVICPENRGTAVALVIRKTTGIITGTRDAKSPVFDLIENEDDFKQYYGKSLAEAPQCTGLIDKLKDWKPSPPAEEPKKEEKETLYEHIAEEQSQGVAVAG